MVVGSMNAARITTLGPTFRYLDLQEATELVSHLGSSGQIMEECGKYAELMERLFDGMGEQTWAWLTAPMPCLTTVLGTDPTTRVDSGEN